METLLGLLGVYTSCLGRDKENHCYGCEQYEFCQLKEKKKKEDEKVKEKEKEQEKKKKKKKNLQNTTDFIIAVQPEKNSKIRKNNPWGACSKQIQNNRRTTSQHF